jgi:hypothetical protein
VSGFWDAVGRAALGLPGTAVPRPRSMFESDAGDRPAADLDATDSEAEVESKSQASADAIQPPSRSPATDVVMRAVDRQAAPEAGEPFDDQPPLERLAEDRLREDRRFVDASQTVEPGSARRPVEEPAGSRTIERVEVHRFETTHIQIDSVATPHGDEQSSSSRLDAAARAVASEPPSVAASEPVVPARVSSDSPAPPIHVVAEPRVIAAATTSDEPEPPLVIEIDRIDIRIESQTPVPASVSRRREAAPAPSLDQYLQARSGAPR